MSTPFFFGTVPIKAASDSTTAHFWIHQYHAFIDVFTAISARHPALVTGMLPADERAPRTAITFTPTLPNVLPYNPVAHAHMTAAEQTKARGEHTLQLGDKALNQTVVISEIVAINQGHAHNISMLDPSQTDVAKGAHTSVYNTPPHEFINNLINHHANVNQGELRCLLDQMAEPLDPAKDFDTQMTLLNRRITYLEIFRGAPLPDPEIVDIIIVKASSGPLAIALSKPVQDYQDQFPLLGTNVPIDKRRTKANAIAIFRIRYQALSHQQRADAIASHAAAQLATVSYSGSPAKVAEFATHIPNDHATAPSPKYPTKKSQRHSGDTTPYAPAAKPTTHTRAALPPYQQHGSSSIRLSTSPVKVYCSRRGMGAHKTVECRTIKDLTDPMEKAYYLSKR